MPNHEQTQKNAFAQQRAAIIADTRATFGTDAGNRELALIRLSVGYGKPSFLPPANGGPLDALAAAFRDGRKSVYDEITSRLESRDDESDSVPRALS